MMTHFSKFAILKIVTIQSACQVALLAAGATMAEACAMTCALSLIAPLYSSRVQNLYRAAFPRAVA